MNNLAKNSSLLIVLFSFIPFLFTNGWNSGCKKCPDVNVTTEVVEVTTDTTIVKVCVNSYEGQNVETGLCYCYDDVNIDRPLSPAGWGNQQAPCDDCHTGDQQFCFKVCANEDQSLQMIGLNSDCSANESFNTIDYAFYLIFRGNRWDVYIYENGASQSWLSLNQQDLEGSSFCIKIEGNTVTYLVNGKGGSTAVSTSTYNGLCLYYDDTYHGTWGNDGESCFNSITHCALPSGLKSGKVPQFKKLADDCYSNPDPDPANLEGEDDDGTKEDISFSEESIDFIIKEIKEKKWSVGTLKNKFNKDQLFLIANRLKLSTEGTSNDIAKRIVDSFKEKKPSSLVSPEEIKTTYIDSIVYVLIGLLILFALYKYFFNHKNLKSEKDN